MGKREFFLIIALIFIVWLLSVGELERRRMYEDFMAKFREEETITQSKETVTIPPKTVKRKVEKPIKKEPAVNKPKETRKRTMVVVATAYYGPLQGQSSYATGSYRGDIKLNGTGVTKSGKKVRVGHIATDWRVIPKGKKLYIPGYGNGSVEDIGGDIKGKRIDVFMGYGEEGLRKAKNWGVRTVEITIEK